MDVVQVDGSSVDRSQSKGFQLNSPVSWFKPFQSTTKKTTKSEIPSVNGLDPTDEELSALNP